MALPKVLERVENVKKFRLKSKSKPTIKLAQTPVKFHVENVSTKSFLLVPRVSSENREYIPIGFLKSDCLASDATLIVKDASIFNYGIMQSKMHMAWMSQVCGRLEGRYRYSKDSL